MTYQSHTPASAVQFEKIGQIAITVSDLERARDFYQNALGMRFLFDASTMSFFQCGDIRLLIGTEEKPGPRGGTILYFKMDNILTVFAQLEARGVEILRSPELVATMPDHELWIGFIKDPDGNVLGVMSEVKNSQ